ncbi:hypothetical protein quinque_002413 [Culex quinquefasciatus]
MGVKVCVVTGRTDELLEVQRLQTRPHIVVAMPCRLAAHLTVCNTHLFRALQFLIVNEADWMLSGSLDNDLKAIGRFLSETLDQRFQTRPFAVSVAQLESAGMTL